MNLSFNCYITDVYNIKKIKVKIEDYDVEKITKIINKLKKEKKDAYHYLYVTLNNKTIIDINTKYSTLNDLIGAYVHINIYSQYYNYSEYVNKTKIKNGYRFICKEINSFVN